MLNANFLRGQGLELIVSSPDTSVASTSYSNAMSFTVGGSLGFDALGPTGSVSGSMTLSNATTRTVSDLQILNRSGADDNLSCQWIYEVVAGSLESEGETPLLAQFLIRRPHRDDPLQIFLLVSCFIDNGGDPGALARNHDWSGADFNSGFDAPDLASIYKNSARLDARHQVTVGAPPAPGSGN